MSQTKKALDRFLAIALSMLMLFAMLPINSVHVLAVSSSKISTNLGDTVFTVNEAKEFTVTLTANEHAGKMAKGSFKFSDPSAITKLEYYETAEGMQGWYELTGEFGPADGFPITDSTSKFRVTFNKAGSYNASIALKDIKTLHVYCSTTANVSVKNNSGVITTDISSKKFVVNKQEEFTFTLTANDDAEKMVKGSYVFSDPDAIDVLEYYETAENIQGWRPLTEDFGPETGFPMEDATSKFRVTFKKAGNFTATVFIKEVETDAEVCKVDANICVAKADIEGISIVPTTNKYVENEEHDLVIVNGTILPEDEVSYTIEGDPDVYRAVPRKSEVGEYKVTIKVDRGPEYNVFTQTVTSKIVLCEITLDEIKINGLEGVYTGQPQASLSVTGEESSCSLKYKLGDEDWSDTIPTVTEAGDYTVLVKVTKVNEEEESKEYPFYVCIKKADQIEFAFEKETQDNLVYGNTAIYNPNGGQSTGIISYEVTAGGEYVNVDNSSGEIKAIKAGGVATITATKAGDNNYNPITATYTINTIKADQTGFTFEKTTYSVQYGTKELKVRTIGGQSGEAVSYEILSGDAASVTTDNNEGVLSFVSGKKSKITLKAILSGGINYNDTSAEACVEIKTNDFSDKIELPGAEWHLENVIIEPTDGYKIATSEQFDTDWEEKIVIVDEGENAQDPIYLKEMETGFISEAIIIPKICIDKTDPTSLKISYSKSIRDVVLETISFRFYKAKAIVTLEATDNVSKIDHMKYKLDDDEEVTISKSEITFSGNKGNVARANFQLSPNRQNSKITLTAYDTAGRSKTFTKDDETIVVDNEPPEVKVEYDNTDARNDNYYNADRTATISIKDNNYSLFKDFLYETGDERCLTINVGKRFKNQDDYEIEEFKLPFEKDGDFYKAEIPFTEEADYNFVVSLSDYSGNKKEFNDSFIIDKTKPDIEIVYDDSDATESKCYPRFYSGKRVATLTVTEHNFDPRGLDVTKFEAKNVQLNEAEELENSFKNWIYESANWSHNGDKHTVRIEFDKDAHYNIELNYSDMAANESDKKTIAFCLDNTKPTNLEISYSESFFDTILNTITFRFYNDQMTVTISAEDETAGVAHFTYSYKIDYKTDKEGRVEVLGSFLDREKNNIEIPSGDVKINGKKATASFEIPPQFRGHISFTATDKSNNESELFEDEKIIVVDNEPPEVKVEYDNTDARNKNYYNADRTATIKICAENFFKDYLYKPINNLPDNKEPYLSIKVKKDNYETEEVMPPFEQKGAVYEAKVKFDESVKYDFEINYRDMSFNKSNPSYKEVFTIDKVKPTVDVSFPESVRSNGKQYREDAKVSVRIVEHNFDAKDVEVAVTTDNPQEKFDYTKYFKDNKNWTTDGDVHIATVTFKKEAHYTFDIKYSDLAGNAFDSFNKVAFTIDKTAPIEMDVKINDVSVAGSMDTFVFSKFYRSAVTVKLSANDEVSGIQSFKYQKIENISEYDENGAWNDYDKDTGIIVEPNEKFVIYFRAEDKAGNVAILCSTGIVVDDKQPIGEIMAPEIDIIPEKSNDNGFYNKNVSVNLKVVDPKYIGNVTSGDGYCSGLNKITYTIKTTNTNAVENGVLFDIASNKTDGGVFDANNLISSWIGKITIDADKFNSNNVTVEITAADNAGNVRVTTNDKIKEPIRIDVTPPKIDISYDNNNADNGSFFKTNRTARIVVTERNFKAEKFIINATFNEKESKMNPDWTKTEGTENLDNTKWTATVPCAADGNYKFSIDYMDLAGNKMSGVTYANGTAAPENFTIDKTLPAVEVSYDNNSAINDNYYKSRRTATITITEQNFDANSVDVMLKATDDGIGSALPAVSGWTTNGDRHTATISYNKDGFYTFDIAARDKSGNNSADFLEQSFYVDETAPTLEITGVDDRSANNDDIIPVVSYSDTNYDDDQVKITLTGAVRKEIALDGSYTEQHNGKVFTFNNFAKEKSVDDIYTLTATLTDKAGNSTEKTIVFSANRFGSTYGFSAATEKLNGAYVQKAEDVVITETNANELKNIKITLFKNNDTLMLKEGDNYKIDVKGGNGQWYEYIYTVFAKNFTDDGVYRLTFYSEDAAGNIAENTLDTKNKEINFGVDKTKPNVIITNLENGMICPLETLTVSVIANDNLLLKSIIAYLDDYDKAYKTWTEKEVANIIAENGEFTFDVAGNSTEAHKIKVVCTDAAGNEQVEEITAFYVTTNLFVRYYNNKTLFFGSVCSVILVISLAIAVVILKKKKKKA